MTLSSWKCAGEGTRYQAIVEINFSLKDDAGPDVPEKVAGRRAAIACIRRAEPAGRRARRAIETPGAMRRPVPAAVEGLGATASTTCPGFTAPEAGPRD